jgi:hypothetical protein
METTMNRVAMPLKIVYTAFVGVLVPYYWVTYTPWNFLYFCDVALLLTLVAVWTENALLVSMSSVGILLPQTLWVLDFVARAVAGIHLTGMTAYMFDPAIPLFVRGLSTFHGWLPFVLLYLLSRLGYDRRAYAAQALGAVGLLLVCFYLAPKPPPSIEFPSHAVNINYVYGMDDQHPQTVMAPALWLLSMILVNVLVLYVPTHLSLKKICAPALSGDRWRAIQRAGSTESRSGTSVRA